MRKNILILFFTILTSISASANKPNDWSKVMDAIIKVESNGNPNAVSKDGKCVGAMQIKKIVVDDCNEYLKRLKNNKQYTYNDRYDVQKSKEMFLLIQKRYNTKNDLEEGIKIWNMGCNYKSKKQYVINAEIYYQKVLNKMKK